MNAQKNFFFAKMAAAVQNWLVKLEKIDLEVIHVISEKILCKENDNYYINRMDSILVIQ